jgi:hypothetical protein
MAHYSWNKKMFEPTLSKFPLFFEFQSFFFSFLPRFIPVWTFALGTDNRVFILSSFVFAGDPHVTASFAFVAFEGYFSHTH